MTSRIDAEHILDAFLAPDADRLPDRVIHAALTDIARTPQRHAVRVPWRFPTMNSYAKAAIAAVVVVVAIGGFALLRPGGSSGVGGAPTAIPSPTPAPSAAPSGSAAASRSLLETTGWVPFTSDRYGYTVSYPPMHPGLRACTLQRVPTRVTQAQRDFAFGTDLWETLGEDKVTPLDEIVYGADPCVIGFMGFAETIPAGTSVDDVISQSVNPDTSSCEPEPITIDGRPGRFYVCGDSLSIAVVIVGDRAFVFLNGRGSDAKDLMLAQLSTVQLPKP